MTKSIDNRIDTKPLNLDEIFDDDWLNSLENPSISNDDWFKNFEQK
jgi:hypothetical protein